jgi:hypothetical protein
LLHKSRVPRVGYSAYFFIESDLSLISLSHHVCLAGAVLLSLLPRASTAWSVSFGGCTFSGPDGGGALVRTGFCSEQSGRLDLRKKGITSVPADAFADMGNLE